MCIYASCHGPSGVFAIVPKRHQRTNAEIAARFRTKLAGPALLRAHLAQDPVLDPMLVPPFDGIHLHAVNLHAEVQVIAAGQAG